MIWEWQTIAQHYPLPVALEKGLNAGVDMFIVSNHEGDRTGEFVNTIARLVRDGKVPESRINEPINVLSPSSSALRMRQRLVIINKGMVSGKFLTECHRLSQ